MIQPSTIYAARAASSRQDTIFVLRLLGAGADLSTEPVLGLPGALPYMMGRPSLAPSSVSPLEGTSAIGTIDVRLLDKDGAVTALERGLPVLGQEHEIWLGYRGIPWAAYIRVLKGRVSAFQMGADGLSYTVTAADRWDEADIARLDPADLAAEPYTEATKSWDGGTLKLSDADGDSAYDTVTIEDTDPVTIGLKMLLSDGSLSGGYNVWPAWAGAGLTTDDVDVPWCEAERAKVILVPMRFVLTGNAENVKNFVEIELCKAVGGYSLLSGEGKLRMHYPSAPIRTADLAIVGDDHLIHKPSWGRPYDLYLSQVRFQLDHDGSDFQTTLPPLCSPQYLDGTYSTEVEHQIASRGLQSDLGGISVAYTVADQLFRRYGTPPPRLKLTVFFAKHTIEAGDVFRCNSIYLPNVDGLEGTQSVADQLQRKGPTRYLEVLQAAPMGDHVELDCIDLTGPNTSPRIAVIAPDGQPDYGDASEAERAYAYIADVSTGEFADGDAAYVLG